MFVASFSHSKLAKKGLFYLRLAFNQILANKLDKNRKKQKVSTNLSVFTFMVITKF